MDHRATDEHEDLLVRLVTAVGKYWICKRTPNHAYEAMECIGGSGVMEDSPFPRLYREAPVNAIWEGSGNVQCLDVLRAMQKTPEVVQAFFAELARARRAERPARPRMWRAAATKLRRPVGAAEYRARDLVDRMALALHPGGAAGAASSGPRHGAGRGAPAAVADAFCASRLDGAQRAPGVKAAWISDALAEQDFRAFEEPYRLAR
jgi:putative acyl-CoA dehydrogenase